MPASGPKSELVTRLFDSLMAEERLLEEGPGGESIDLSGVNMDEVLGLDDEKDTHSSITANEDIEEGKEKQPARFFVFKGNIWEFWSIYFSRGRALFYQDL